MNIVFTQVAVLGSGILLLIGCIAIFLGKFPEVGVAALALFIAPPSSKRTPIGWERREVTS